jgi:GH15 family glucan-1,4-alpha-glucosidase
MTQRIEDYALIGNCETTALVGRDGSIDWLALPRFDSAACFAALLGARENGCWRVAPTESLQRTSRRYRGNTLILETQFETATGVVCLTDLLIRRDGAADLIRQVRGVSGSVAMQTELVVRFDYGSVVPWVSRREDGRLEFIAGPDRLILDTAVPLHGENLRTFGNFTLAAGQVATFILTWTPSFKPYPARLDADAAMAEAARGWEDWSGQFKPRGEWDAAVLRSLLTLKALAHFETGGIVAAATTSLPEQIGGARNWDYRYCWLRDATLTLYALMQSGFLDEAAMWRSWLVRAVAGKPENLQIMYGVAGERRLTEYEVPWLSGYEASAPVRVGNAAHGQRQLDVYGEVIDAFYAGRRLGLSPDASSWALECKLVAHLETIWDQPDDGIWEMRGPPRHFTHSKVMAWVAFDRIVRSAEEFGLDGPVAHWKAVRDCIHADICRQGFNAELGSFVQSYGSDRCDASLLMIALVGFLPAADPRVVGTVAAIERQLLRGGFVLRYDTGPGADGLPPGEGAFLACSFWLADNYVLQGRIEEARALFGRLVALSNDVGLLAEEYDPMRQRQTGNFPQAFSHLALIGTAHNLLEVAGPARQRSAQTSATR